MSSTPPTAQSPREPDGTSGFAIVIPALNPGDSLPGYVAALRARCDVPILLVDDGSREESRPVFAKCAAEVPGVSVLVHETNRGKGRALKTAFAHLLERHPGLRGCVTCDSDGQHAPEDVEKCLAALARRPDCLVLGCRTFNLSHVPWKSRWGNNSMRFLFRLVTGRNFLDTQTGLRAFPADFMRELLDCPGERFEFETHMLLRLGNRDLVQIPVQTLYADGNRETHFNPFRDSLRVVTIILAEGAAKFGRFVLFSVLSFGLDIALFSFLYYIVFSAEAKAHLLLSVVLARAVSLLFNYSANRYFVFGDARTDRRFDGAAFKKYLLLALAIMGASYALTRFFHCVFPGIALPWVKAVVDGFLFLASYGVQRVMIFCHRDS